MRKTIIAAFVLAALTAEVAVGFLAFAAVFAARRHRVAVVAHWLVVVSVLVVVFRPQAIAAKLPTVRVSDPAFADVFHARRSSRLRLRYSAEHFL